MKFTMMMVAALMVAPNAGAMSVDQDMMTFLARLKSEVPSAQLKDFKGAETFWRDVSDLMVRCMVQSLPGGSLRSVCSDVESFGGAARFMLNGAKYYAVLSESTYSDGGDLDDVRVFLADGTEVAQRRAVPSYGDVFLALAGGQDGFRQER